MTRITREQATSYEVVERRSLDEVLDLGKHYGPSPRGSSYYGALLKCPREFALRYIVGLEPAQEAEQLVVGTLYHLCLERYYTTLRKEQQAVPQGSPMVYRSKAGIGAAYQVLDVLDAEPGYADTSAQVRSILDRYFDEYIDEKLRVLAAEETVGYKGAFWWTARLDLCVIDDKDGGFYLLEAKTARTIDKNMLGNYEMDLQVLGQAWLVQNVVDLSKYPRFKGVLVNIATKHKVPRLYRFPVCPSPQHLQMFERTVFDVTSMRDWAQMRGWPMALGHCSGYARGYSSCQFYDLCHAFPHVSVAERLAERETGEAPLGFVYKKLQEETAT